VVALEKDRKQQEGAWQEVRHYANLGTELVVAVLLGAWCGWKLDQWLETKPWFFLLGFFFGISAGFLNIFRLVTSEAKRKGASKKGKGNTV